MNKFLLIALLLFVIIGGGWLLWPGGSSESEDEPQVVEVDVVTTEDDRDVVEDSREEGEEATEGDIPTSDDASVVVVPISGTNFSFSAETITVTQGDTVRIDFISEDGLHDWVVDEFDAATEQVRTGDTSSVEFVADQVGEFEFYCSVGNHRAQGMVGTLVVEAAL